MINIFDMIKFSDEITLDDWNKITKEVFFQFFDNEEKYLDNKELLRTELMNYIYSINEDDDKYILLHSIYNEFKQAISTDTISSIKELYDNFNEVAKTDGLYMYNYTSAPENFSSYTLREFAMYYFESIDKIIEGCFKPRLELFYKFYSFNINGKFPRKEKSFGNLVKEINRYDNLLKDPFFNISINQWRNISAHKSFNISINEITVRYGTDNKHKAILTHEQLKDIAFWVNNVYSILRLAEVIIHLNYIKEIKALDKTNNINISINSEACLLGIIHNLQIVGFEYDSFNETKDTFELTLYMKKNKDIQESIIHASQIFTQIAMALNDDEFQKGKFEFIKINIIDKNKILQAYATIDIQSCLDFSYNKIDMKDLINKIIFKIHNKDEHNA